LLGFIHATLLAARGNVESAMPTFEYVRKHSAPGAPPTAFASMMRADALLARGDPQAAEAVLLQAGPRQTMYPFGGSRGYIWLRLRAKLLGLERQLGHRDRAAEIERELRELLVAADPDFALVRDLN
jgi:hypothetical protein